MAYTRRDYFTQRFSRDELAGVLARANLKPSEALSKRSAAYLRLGLADRVASEDELLEMLVAEPTMLRRPLVVAPGMTVQGFDRVALGHLADGAGIGTGER